MLTPSLNTLAFPDWTLSQVISFAQDNAVPFIEIRALENTVDLLAITDFSSPQKIQQSANLLKQAGVKILSLNLGFHLSEDLSTQRDAIWQYAALAQQLDIPYLRFFSGGQTDKRPNVDQLTRAARQVIDLLAPYPVEMIIETHDALVHSEDILALNRGLDGRLNVLWDIAHTQNYGGERWSATYAQIKPLIRYLHVKDTRRVEGKIQNLPLFEGDLDVRALLTFFAQQPEAVIVSFEWEKMWDPTLEPGDTAARDFLAKVREVSEAAA